MTSCFPNAIPWTGILQGNPGFVQTILKENKFENTQLIERTKPCRLLTYQEFSQLLEQDGRHFTFVQARMTCDFVMYERFRGKLQNIKIQWLLKSAAIVLDAGEQAPLGHLL